ncbi:MAG: tetraacyldisaccharide 4'-kinase [Hyphomicrobium sp.]
MRLDEPAWWYAGPADGGLAARLLQPLARLVARIAENRFASTVPYRSRLPVICIGNFTAGGTGKTPTTELVAAYLESLGKRPVVLSRGYGGRLRGPLFVERGTHTSSDVGDEPLLLARHAPVVVARKRDDGARFIETNASDTGTFERTVIVMDDGLQNPLLAKNLTIALVDARRGIGNGSVIPAGPLRANLDFQLSLVDCIVVVGESTDATKPSIMSTLKHRFEGPVLAARHAAEGSTEWLRDAPVLAYAAIADPGRFFRLLERLGAHLVGAVAFRDHRPFTKPDAERLLMAAADAGAQLVTTEKDLARLSSATGLCARLRGASRALPVKITLDEPATLRLEALIRAAIASVRTAS